MERDKNRFTFVTDRTPEDQNIHSSWLWSEILDLAKSGKEIQVQLLNSKLSLPNEFHHPRIHVIPGTFIHPQNLVMWKPGRIHVIEPLDPNSWLGRSRWSLWLILLYSLKQASLHQAEISTTIFSSALPRLPLMGEVFYTHPLFPAERLHNQTRMISMGWMDTDIEPHWSLENMDLRIVIPGSLAQVESLGPQNVDHLKREMESELTNHPWHSFLFLGGMGKVSLKTKNQFLRHEFGAKILFPEGLSGPQQWQALKMGRESWLNFLPQNLSLVGAAMQIQKEKYTASLSAKSVYALV